MSIWLLLSVPVAILLSACTGVRALMWLSIIYGCLILGAFFWLAAPR